MAISLRTSKHMHPKAAARSLRAVRGRKKIFGYPERPRMVVTKTSRNTWVQVVDDVAGKTLASASTHEVGVRDMAGDKTAKAAKVGELIAQRAKDAGIDQVVFDRAGNKYHGRIAALADAARKAGLEL